jgi:hypothetical protein
MIVREYVERDGQNAADGTESEQAPGKNNEWRLKA